MNSAPNRITIRDSELSSHQETLNSGLKKIEKREKRNGRKEKKEKERKEKKREETKERNEKKEIRRILKKKIRVEKYEFGTPS